MKTQRRVRTLLGVLITLLALIPVFTGERFQLLERFEQDLYDLRIKQALLNEVDPRIVIIDVDERTMQREGRWPWSRDKVALLVDQLFERYGVAIAGFDVVFSEPDNDLSLFTLRQVAEGRADLQLKDLLQLSTYLYPDRRLAAALTDRPVVLGYPFDHGTGQDNIGSAGRAVMKPEPRLETVPIPTANRLIGNLEMLQAQTPWSGFFDNPIVDSDGVYRRVPLVQRFEGEYYPSLALAMVLALFGESQVMPVLEPDATGSRYALTAVDVAGIRVPVDETGAVLVPYRGPQGSFPYVSATDVLRGEADPAVLEGAIVLVGTTAAGLLDLRVTPLSHRYPGVEVHANIISGILDERMYYRPDYVAALEALQILLFGVLLSVVLPGRGVVRGALVGGFCLGAVIAFNLWAWHARMWVLPLGYTLLLLSLLLIFMQASGFLLETRSRKRLAGLFGQYIPPEIVKELDAQGAAAQMRGESRDMTVFFSDIREFTGLSESLTPQQLTRMMNIYLTEMTGIIHAHKGTVDKYIGDAVMAFWGAPLANPAHPALALDAAMAMQAALPAVNRALESEGLPPVNVGMGLNSGEMSVGNMGSSFRMAYTVMGDAVNLASRLEGLTSVYGVPVIVSGELAERVADYRFMELDRVRVKGRQEPVSLYLPLGRQGKVDPAVLEQADRFAQVLTACRTLEWSRALELLAKLEGELVPPRLIALYRQRIESALHSPDKVWDGVHNHRTKK